MKYRIIAKTPFGIITGIPTELSDEEVGATNKLLNTICENGPYFTFRCENGSKVFLPIEMIQQSIFELLPY